MVCIVEDRDEWTKMKQSEWKKGISGHSERPREKEKKENECMSSKYRGQTPTINVNS